MDVGLAIKQRMEELGLEQRDLAAAATVTESYISQLLTRKKMPPASDRTDIYDKLAKVLKLPVGKLVELADLQRKEELKRSLADQPAPLLKHVRAFILRKCAADKRDEVAAIFEKQPFGELERLVTQKLLDVVKRIVKGKLSDEHWLQGMARVTGRNHEQMRVAVLEFLDVDIFQLSVEHCDVFVGRLIESWDINLVDFEIDIVLNSRLAAGKRRKLEFVESDVDRAVDEEPGLRRFLQDSVLSGDAAEEEIEFLKRLRFNNKRPTALYFYRELQNLRDPLSFRLPMAQVRRKSPGRRSKSNRSNAPMRKYLDASHLGKQLQVHSRKRAVELWAKSKRKRGGK